MRVCGCGCAGLWVCVGGCVHRCNVGVLGYVRVRTCVCECVWVGVGVRLDLCMYG